MCSVSKLPRLSYFIEHLTGNIRKSLHPTTISIHVIAGCWVLLRITQHPDGLSFGSNSMVRLLSPGVHTHNIRALRSRHTDYSTAKSLSFRRRPGSPQGVCIVGLSLLINITTYHPQQITRATTSFRYALKIPPVYFTRLLIPSPPTLLHKTMPPFYTSQIHLQARHQLDRFPKEGLRD